MREGWPKSEVSLFLSSLEQRPGMFLTSSGQWAEGQCLGTYIFTLSTLPGWVQPMQESREQVSGFGEHEVRPRSMRWVLSVHSPPAAVHGSRPEEVIDHKLTEREWAEEWKHLNNVSVQARATGAMATAGALPNL